MGTLGMISAVIPTHFLAPAGADATLCAAGPGGCGNLPLPRVGADLCVRPWAGAAKERVRADTSVGPYRADGNLHQPRKNGRGRSRAPT